MPKLGRYAPILKAVVFLYPDQDSAKQGIRAGGTGFLVAVPFEIDSHFVHVHAVTNYHVAVFNEDGPPSPVVRVNRLDGGVEPFEFDPSEWVFNPRGPDIAISPPLELNDKVHETRHFGEDWFMTAADEKQEEIGPGEDVFMIGRFVDYDGVQTNVPAARFGHISMMGAGVKQSTGYVGRSIVLDMHSRSGYSGSPVVLYRTLGSHFLEGKPNTILTGGGHYIKLLGIHYAQFPEIWDLKAKRTKDPLIQSTLKADTHYVKGLSGMTCVVPAEEILSLLKGPELAAMRRKREARITRAILAAGVSLPKPEGATPVPETTGENPNHREDFNSLLGVAARKPQQDGPT